MYPTQSSYLHQSRKTRPKLDPRNNALFITLWVIVKSGILGIDLKLRSDRRDFPYRPINEFAVGSIGFSNFLQQSN